MRGKVYCASFLFLLVAAFPAAPVRAQEPTAQDEEIMVRGAFLTTRPAKKENRKPAPETSNKTSPPTPASNAAPVAKKNSNAKTSATAMSKKVAKPDGKSVDGHESARRDKRRAQGKEAGSANESGGAPGSQSGSQSGNEPGTGARLEVGDASHTAHLPLRPIGLGYTLFTVGDNGEPLRTDPTREFRTGEAVRLALETNTEGYLYIFHTEDDGEPQMIFPDVRLGGGNNLVRAHVPYEIPSSREAEEALRWFVFKDPAAAERLYVVLTREPLTEVPTGDALSAYCFDAGHTCPWRPEPAIWTKLKLTQAREQVAVSRTKDQGLAQTEDEREATARGLGLAIDAPPPSIIRMTASAHASILVTTIDLIHK